MKILKFPTSTKRFFIIFALGMAGVLSLLLIDFSALASLARAGTDIPKITPALKVLSLVQPTLILCLAVFVGIILAPRVGLSAPVVEALVARRNILAAFKPQIIPGIAGGLLGGFCLVFTTIAFRPFLSLETLERISNFTKLMPLGTRLLYGGIAEELLLRWGFMTLLVWLSWRFIQKRQRQPSHASIVSSIVLSSIIFSVGHLPIAVFLIPHPTLPLIVYVIVANSIFGLIAGYLYWKKGLEAAMIAHVCAHLIMFGANYISY